MRTLDDAEKNYDEALATGAVAVAVMDEKLKRLKRDATRLVVAMTLASGGKIEITHRDLIDAFYGEYTIEENQQTGGMTITAKRRK